MTAKMAGADCPGCAEPFCAEFALLGEAPRWNCGSCGLGGYLFGQFTARKPATPAPAAPAKRHWREKATP